MLNALKRRVRAIAPASVLHAWGTLRSRTKATRARRAFDAIDPTAPGNFSIPLILPALMRHGYQRPAVIRLRRRGAGAPRRRESRVAR